VTIDLWKPGNRICASGGGGFIGSKSLLHAREDNRHHGIGYYLHQKGEKKFLRERGGKRSSMAYLEGMKKEKARGFPRGEIPILRIQGKENKKGGIIRKRR